MRLDEEGWIPGQDTAHSLVSDHPPYTRAWQKPEVRLPEVKLPEEVASTDLESTVTTHHVHAPIQAIFDRLLARAPASFYVASPDARDMVDQLRSLSETVWRSASIDTWTELWDAVIKQMARTSYQTSHCHLEHWWIWLHEQLRSDVATLELSCNGGIPRASSRQQPDVKWFAAAAVTELLQWSEARIFAVWQTKLSNTMRSLSAAIVSLDAWSQDLEQTDVSHSQPTMDGVVAFLDQVCVTCEQCGFRAHRRLRIFWVIYRQMAMVAVSRLFQLAPLEAGLEQVETNWCRLSAWWQRYVVVVLPGGCSIISPLILLEDGLRTSRYMQHVPLQDRVLRHQILCANLRSFEEQWQLPTQVERGDDHDASSVADLVQTINSQAT